MKLSVPKMEVQLATFSVFQIVEVQNIYLPDIELGEHTLAHYEIRE